MVDDRKHTEADLTRKRYPGFVLENQEKGRENTERRQAMGRMVAFVENKQGKSLYTRGAA